MSRILALYELVGISYVDLAAMARAEEAEEVFFELSVEQKEHVVPPRTCSSSTTS